MLAIAKVKAIHIVGASAKSHLTRLSLACLCDSGTLGRDQGPRYGDRDGTTTADSAIHFDGPAGVRPPCSPVTEQTGKLHYKQVAGVPSAHYCSGHAKWVCGGTSKIQV